ncbi:MAG TPA: Maf family protein [Oligoflexus sp.]|uniref:Maf family protein n=1 Tax=Oligoflexus sp. TaxID=1971216 RepID=UPI002D5ACA58|nr:Maf family protein [Oligoflexus sp.]HYX34872.1 Maf family protein [Oligoflexus sp.]
MKINRLVLASTSRFRRVLLEQSGIQVFGIAPQCDEEAIVGSDPWQTARLRADAKALSVEMGAVHENSIVIAADQVLEFQGRAFGKAADEDEARLRLREFSGQVHRLHSAFSLAFYEADHAEPKLLSSEVVTATLGMRTLAADELEAYLRTREWEGCAGCYQYENKGAQLFDWVDGDHTTIIGLPVLALLKQLRKLGINTLTQPMGPWTCETVDPARTLELGQI